jgi:hypothetical protein
MPFLEASTQKVAQKAKFEIGRSRPVQSDNTTFCSTRTSFQSPKAASASPEKKQAGKCLKHGKKILRSWIVYNPINA